MSKIEWTDLTQNPLKRADGGNYCEKISPGCANCYASDLNSKSTRFGGNGRPFSGSNQSRPEMVLDVEMLEKWGRMRKAKKIFLCSMTDMFGEWVPDEMIFQMLDAMAAAPAQTFQILTKRPERVGGLVAEWLAWNGKDILPSNIWLGISAEDQRRLDERLQYLVETQAQTRFLSLEPLLGSIKLHSLQDVDWIIIGAESGADARPMDLEWVQDILDQCQAANVPAFIKQLGKKFGYDHPKGGNWNEWHPDFWVRMWPENSWADMAGGEDETVPGP